LVRSDLYSRAGRFDEAINLLTRITKRLPDVVVARHLLGQVALQARRPGLAITEFTEVTQQVPRNAWARLSVATAYVQAGRPQEALEELDRVAKPLAKVPTYHLHRGRDTQC